MNKIVAVQGNHPSKLNPVTDTSVSPITTLFGHGTNNTSQTKQKHLKTLGGAETEKNMPLNIMKH